MKKKVILYFSLLTVFTSCENFVLEEELATNNPTINFDYLWQKCYEEYSYFDVKNIDWQSVKQKYQKSLFEDMSQDSLFNVLSAMLNELKDDHVNLFSNFRTSFFGNKLTKEDSFDWKIITDNYFTSKYEITGSFQHNFITDEIGYIRLSSFANTINNSELDYMLTRYKNTRGLIIDIRENGGGKIENVYKILERFIDSKTKVYYSRIKNGIQKDDFSEAKPVYIIPHNGVKYLKPIAVLVDAGTFSSGSLFALASKAIKNIRVIGQKTSGGLGIPRTRQLPNGWYFRYSVTQTLDLEKSPNQENGVIPNTSISFNWLDRKKDEILDNAIRNGNNGLLD